jgi:hypothetical protein
MRHNDFFYPDRPEDMPIMKTPPHFEKLYKKREIVGVHYSRFLSEALDLQPGEVLDCGGLRGKNVHPTHCD